MRDYSLFLQSCWLQRPWQRARRSWKTFLLWVQRARPGGRTTRGGHGRGLRARTAGISWAYLMWTMTPMFLVEGAQIATTVRHRCVLFIYKHLCYNLHREALREDDWTNTESLVHLSFYTCKQGIQTVQFSNSKNILIKIIFSWPKKNLLPLANLPRFNFQSGIKLLKPKSLSVWICFVPVNSPIYCYK